MEARDPSQQSPLVDLASGADPTSTELLAAIVRSSQDAIIGKSLTGTIVSWNLGAERLYGWSAAEAIGRSVDLLVPPDHRLLELELFSRITAGDDLESHEVRRQHRDGRLLDVSLSMSPIRDRFGTIIGVATSSRDIGARRLAEAARAAQVSAEQANVAKGEFLSRMSHELRTPLNAVLGFAQILDISNLDPAQRDAVAHILQGGNNLLELINDVLDITGVDADMLELRVEPVDVAELVAEAIAIMRPTASTAHVALHLSRTVTTAPVSADRRRLRQVVLNLISNAIKFNVPGGRVEVGCSIVDAGHVAVSVTDDGVGIRPADLPRLFNPFDRLGRQSAGIDGTGVGLALSKRLVDVLGGGLEVESTVGVGTAFTLTMPLITGYDVADVTAPVIRSTVLYIEDNHLNVALMTKIIGTRPAWQLVSAFTAAAGLQLAASVGPTVVLLDLHLPDLDGHEVLRELRADPSTACIPIAVLGADASQRQIDRLLGAGADVYITKPFQVYEVLDFIDAHARTAPP